ncbi:hypothetical protein R1flu_028249 [Riccia fluitans]|uniref:Uncharacterized protein n=1 Tax=Riccia fluitans TaxID=41844 RepID=A0ABD1XP04_9MARC
MILKTKSIEIALPHHIGLFMLPLSSTGSGNLNPQLHQVQDFEKTMDCPHCYKRLLCDNCDRGYKKNQSHFKAPGCEHCKFLYEITITDLERELASLRPKFAEQQSASKLAQRKLSERMAFLKLRDPNPSIESFKGDVTIDVHGCDTILAHRFILNVRLWDAGEQDWIDSHR